MHTSLAKKLAKKMKQSAGFTLLEILVVLTIMGFLIAMVAPRLAGISGGAVDTVCDSNQNRMVSMMSGYFEKTNRYPDKLTNLVEETTAGEYQIPAVSDDDPDNGAETLASELMARNNFRIHYLTEEEVRELKQLGIVNVFNLNAYDGYNEDGDAAKSGYELDDSVNNQVTLTLPVVKAPVMEEFTLDPDVAANPIAVMMVGAGVNAAGVWQIHDEERGWGEADFMGRIVFGFGPENALVTSGIVSNAAHCPGGIQNADNVTYNDYNLVLPRLAATVDEDITGYETALLLLDAVNDEDGIQIGALSYDEAPTANYEYVANADNFKTRVYDLGAMEPFQYATMCPEGHKFPADDAEFWGVDLNPTPGPGGPAAGSQIN